MDFQQWAKETHRALMDRPAYERIKDFSIVDVELVLRTGISTLIDILIGGESLTLKELGRFWVKKRQAYTLTSNLHGQIKQVKIPDKRIVCFHASSRLVRTINRRDHDHT